MIKRLCGSDESMVATLKMIIWRISSLQFQLAGTSSRCIKQELSCKMWASVGWGLGTYSVKEVCNASRVRILKCVGIKQYGVELPFKIVESYFGWPSKTSWNWQGYMPYLSYSARISRTPFVRVSVGLWMFICCAFLAEYFFQILIFKKPPR